MRLGLIACNLLVVLLVCAVKAHSQDTSAAPQGAALKTKRPVKAQSAGRCSGWQAVLDRRLSGPATLRVTGECVFPAPGYKVELVRRVPQGINPYILILDRQVRAPMKPVARAKTTEKILYEKESSAAYQTVNIQPDGIDITVKDIH